MGSKPKLGEVQRVLDALSEEEIKQLRKENPFRVDRVNKIKELYRRGVKVHVLSEITGFSKTSIYRFIRSEPKFYINALIINF